MARKHASQAFSLYPKPSGLRFARASKLFYSSPACFYAAFAGYYNALSSPWRGFSTIAIRVCPPLVRLQEGDVQLADWDGQRRPGSMPAVTSLPEQL
jgi:hypothetical protein